MKANSSFWRAAVVGYLRCENFAFQEFEILNAFQVNNIFTIAKAVDFVKLHHVVFHFHSKAFLKLFF